MVCYTRRHWNAIDVETEPNALAVIPRPLRRLIHHPLRRLHVATLHGGEILGISIRTGYLGILRQPPESRLPQEIPRRRSAFLRLFQRHITLHGTGGHRSFPACLLLNSLECFEFGDSAQLFDILGGQSLDLLLQSREFFRHRFDHRHFSGG